MINLIDLFLEFYQFWLFRSRYLGKLVYSFRCSHWPPSSLWITLRYIWVSWLLIFFIFDYSVKLEHHRVQLISQLWFLIAQFFKSLSRLKLNRLQAFLNFRHEFLNLIKILTTRSSSFQNDLSHILTFLHSASNLVQTLNHHFRSLLTLRTQLSLLSLALLHKR